MYFNIFMHRIMLGRCIRPQALQVENMFLVANSFKLAITFRYKSIFVSDYYTCIIHFVTKNTASSNYDISIGIRNGFPNFVSLEIRKHFLNSNNLVMIHKSLFNRLRFIWMI